MTDVEVGGELTIGEGRGFSTRRLSVEDTSTVELDSSGLARRRCSMCRCRIRESTRTVYVRGPIRSRMVPRIHLDLL